MKFRQYPWQHIPEGKTPPTFREVRSLTDAIAANAGYQTRDIQAATAHSDEAMTLMYQADHDLPHDDVDVVFNEEMIQGKF